MGVTMQRLPSDTMWAHIRQLVERAPSLDALRAHRIQFLAASLWREENRPVPTELVNEARIAAVTTVAAPALLKLVRAAYDGALMLMKGPEVAANYPDPSARYFRDLDLLADDPVAAQQALIKAGFLEIQSGHDYSGDQHLCPLLWPGIPLAVEIHRWPSCPGYLKPPSAEELLSLGTPSATEVDRLLAPTPAAHALLLVAHAWTHQPLGKLGDLIDVAVTLPPDQRPEAEALAERWGWSRMWRCTLGVTDDLIGRGTPAPALRTWARHLAEVRESSVLAAHVAGVVAPLVALAPSEAPRALAWAVRNSLGPGPDENWAAKLSRATRALRHPLHSKSQHDRRIGRDPWSR